MSFQTKKIHKVIAEIDSWVENNSYNGGLFTHNCVITEDGGLMVRFVCSDTCMTTSEKWDKTFIDQLDISNVDLYTQNILYKLKGDYYKKKSKLKKRSKYIKKILNN